MDGDRGDLAEFGKKRNTDNELFFQPHYMWAENNKAGTAQVGAPLKVQKEQSV